MRVGKIVIFLLSLGFFSLSQAFCGEEPSPVTSVQPPSEEELLQQYHQGREAQMLASLIDLTEQTLLQQKELQKMLEDYLQAQKSFMANQKDKRLGYRFLSSAEQLKDKIDELGFAYLFRKGFVEELSSLSSIAQGEEQVY